LLLCVPALTQTTPNLGLNVLGAGSNVGTWGPVINLAFSANHQNIICRSAKEEPGVPRGKGIQPFFLSGVLGFSIC
jgi:hypothetical protein